MKVGGTEGSFDRELHAEVGRILQLLERTRRTRHQARLLIALETGVSRRKAGRKLGSVSRPVRYRPILPGSPAGRTND